MPNAEIVNAIISRRLKQVAEKYELWKEGDATRQEFEDEIFGVWAHVLPHEYQAIWSGEYTEPHLGHASEHFPDLWTRLDMED